LRAHYPTFGGGTLNDWLELKRENGMKVAKQCGLAVAEYAVFTDWAPAVKYAREHKTGLVAKWEDNQSDDTRVTATGEEMAAHLEETRAQGEISIKGGLLLQDTIEGNKVEISQEAWWNGKHF